MGADESLRKSLEARAKEPLLYLSEILKLVKKWGYRTATTTILKRSIERRNGVLYEPEIDFSSSKDGSRPRLCSYKAASELLAYLESKRLIDPLNGMTLEYLMQNGYHTESCSASQPTPGKPRKESPESLFVDERTNHPPPKG